MDKIDPFTQRMLERARVRKEKLDAKIPPSEKHCVRKPLTENNHIGEPSDLLTSPRRKENTVNSKCESIVKTSSIERKVKINSNTPSKIKTSVGEDIDSGVAVEINIVHQNNVQVDVQVEEREVTLTEYLKEKEGRTKMIEDSRGSSNSGSTTSFHSILSVEKGATSPPQESAGVHTKADITEQGKSKLRRLGQLYSGNGLFSPINSRTELNFASEPTLKSPVANVSPKAQCASSSPRENSTTEVDEPRRVLRNRHATSRFAALANHINNMEDDMRHINFKNKDSKTVVNAAPTVSARNDPTSRLSLVKQPEPTPPKAPTKSSLSFRKKSVSGIETKNALQPHVAGSSPKIQSPVSSRVTAKGDKNNSPDLKNKDSKTTASTKSDTFLRSSLVKQPEPALPKTETKSSLSFRKKVVSNNEARTTFQPHVVGSSTKVQSPIGGKVTSKWDKSILQDLTTCQSEKSFLKLQTQKIKRDTRKIVPPKKY